MKAKRTLAIMALTTLVGCSSRILPAQTQTLDLVDLRLHSTRSTMLLVMELATEYRSLNTDMLFTMETGSYDELVDQLKTGHLSYFVSNHLWLEDDPDLWAAPIARDGIVMIVHPNVSVASLSIQQLRRIYQGFIINWRQVGGSDLPIRVVSRESDSATRAEFERLLTGQRRITANAEVVPTTEAMIQRVLEQAGSIGYITLGQMREGVSILSIDDVVPSQATIVDNLYPLRTTIFIVGLSEPVDHFRAFVGWMQSSAGQTIVARNFVPLP